MAQGSRYLKVGELLEVLNGLNKNHGTGTLILQRESTTKFLYLQDGQVIFAASNAPEDKFTQILMDAGKLTADQLNMAIEKKAARTIGRTLVELGFISSEDLLDSLVAQVRRVCSSVVHWNSGTSAFKQNILPPGVAKLPITTPRLLVDTALTITDRVWVGQTLGGLETVLQVAQSERDVARELPPTAEELKLLEALDGKRTIGKACEKAGVDSFYGAKFLLGLFYLGLIHRKEVLKPKEQEEDAVDLSFLDEVVPTPATPKAPLPPPPPEPEPEPPTPSAFVLETEPEPARAESPWAPPAAPVPERVPEPEPEPPTPAMEAASQSWEEAAQEPPLREEAPREEHVPIRPIQFGEVPSQPPERPPAPPPKSAVKEKRGAPLKRSAVPRLAALAAVLLVAAIAGAYFVFFRGEGGPPEWAKGLPLVGRKPAPAVPKPAVPKPAVPQPKPPVIPPSPPAAANEPAVALPAPQPVAQPPKPAPQPAGGTGRSLLLAGRYDEAARAFGKEVGSLRGGYTVDVEVACQPDTIRKGLEAAAGNTSFTILPYDLKGRSCYRVVWGHYATRAEAEAALAALPGFFKEHAAPRVSTWSKAHKGG